MKKINLKLITSILAIFILVISLIITILDAVIPLNIWVHPILTFIFCLFVGFGCTFYFLGFVKKSPFNFFLGAILLSLAFIYAFCASLPKFWWLSIIVVVVVLAVTAIVSVVLNGNRTESIAENEDK